MVATIAALNQVLSFFMQSETIAELLRQLDAGQSASVEGVRIKPSSPAHKLLTHLSTLTVCDYCERRTAGIREAKKAGKFIGGKKGAGVVGEPSQARKLREKGLSYREIAAELGISRQTALRYCQQSDD